MEVLVALPPSMDFNFESSCSTPYISAPSSPKLVGEIYFSAPTSPKHAAAFYRNISFIQRRSASFDGSPLVWEENTEQTANSDLIDDDGYQEDFAFDFSGHLDTSSLTADELFDGGKIKPLKPQQFRISVSGSKSPKWSKKKRNSENDEQRGREKVSPSSSSNPKHRATRSLSPLKLSEFISQDQEEEEQQQQSNRNTTAITKSSSFSFFTKWKLKDLLLFRSASEGRALDNDPLKKYTSMGQKHEDLDSRNSSFRSTGGSSHVGSSHGGSTIRRGSVSAHELHYKSNRAVHDQMKRKTFLPYRKGLLGCIGFNPTVSGIAKGLNSIKGG